ncbi:protease HtpX [Peptococcaceae bacterium]|nr:protease HtpX [Peptococcaceae bacterium]
MIKRVALFLLVNILVLTTIVIMVSIFGIGNYLTAYGIDYFQLLVFSAVIGFSGAFISLLLSKWMAKWMLKVRIIDPNSKLSPAEKELLEMVYRIAKKAGLKKMPEVGIYPSKEVNAFATGPSRNNALVAVSSGLLEHLDRDAVEGVVAHEVAHIANGDMVTMTLLQGIINTFVVFLARIVAYFVSSMVRSEMAGIVYITCVIIFQIFFSILGSIVVMAFSRYREYQADAGGALLAGKDKMVHALKSLKRTLNLVETEHASIQTFKINGGKSSWLKLFASHPDIDDRIKRLIEK